MISIKKSFYWAGIEQLVPKSIGFVISVILARMLEPSDYGLYGMLTLFMGLATIFADSGFSAALIQQETITADDETSIFALNIVVGALLAGFLCLISPLVAQFYNQPILVALLRVNSLSILISSFGIVQFALLSREMRFQNTALISCATAIVSGIVGVFMAYSGCGVWSLLGVSIAGSITRTMLYWKLNRWRPHGKVNISSIRTLWSFSAYLLGCSLIGLAYQNLYSVTIGKVYSAEKLGYYNRANGLRMLPVGIISGVISRVTFPLFSRNQNNHILLLEHLRKITRCFLMLSTALLVLLFVVADPLIPFMLSEKWRPAVPLLRILCFASIFTPISTLHLNTLTSMGYSNLFFRLEVIKIVTAIITVLLIYHYGVTALAWNMVMLAIISYFLNAWFIVKLLGYKWRMQIFDMLPSFTACFFAGWVAWEVNSLYEMKLFVQLTVQSGTFVILLCGGIFLFKERYFFDIWNYIKLGFLRIFSQRFIFFLRIIFRR